MSIEHAYYGYIPRPRVSDSSMAGITQAFNMLNDLAPDDWFLYGSVGRRVAIAAQNGVKPIPRISPDLHSVDLDIAVDDKACSWTAITDIGRHIFDITRGEICLDPHLYREELGLLTINSAQGETQYPSEWLKPMKQNAFDTEVNTPELPAHLLLFATTISLRKKDWFEWIRLFAAVEASDQWSDPRSKVALDILSTYIKSHPDLVASNLIRTFWHILVPQKLRERLALRKRLTGKASGIKYGYQSLEPIYI